jgi:ribose 5-phosphate isomerase A
VNPDELKRQAAERAVELVEPGMKLGLGTGSTARYVLEAIAARRGRGELDDIVGVPTSVATRERARSLGIPLSTLNETMHLDVTLDGADEVDPDLELIKGMGGALLWEKIVATATDRMIVVVDESKLVDRLGSKSPVPVEVIPFGWPTLLAPIRALGAEPTLRTDGTGEPFITDGGHYLLECRFARGLDDPSAIEQGLRSRPGVVDSGLFLGLAETVVVGTPDGPVVRERSGP